MKKAFLISYVIISINILFGCSESKEIIRVREIVTQAINDLNQPSNGYMIGASDKSFISFYPDYWQLLNKYPHVKIENFTLNINNKNVENIKVEVKGKLTNLKGKSIDITPIFVLKKIRENSYAIIDSYNYLLFPELAKLPLDKSDFEKANYINDKKY